MWGKRAHDWVRHPVEAMQLAIRRSTLRCALMRRCFFVGRYPADQISDRLCRLPPLTNSLADAFSQYRDELKARRSENSFCRRHIRWKEASDIAIAVACQLHGAHGHLCSPLCFLWRGEAIGDESPALHILKLIANNEDRPIHAERAHRGALPLAVRCVQRRRVAQKP